MKRFTLTMAMFVGLFSSCSSDDLTVVNEESVGVLSTPTVGNCVEASALGGSAAFSYETGLQMTFTWNNTVAHEADKTYISHIEIAEDPSCPSPAGAAPVAATYPIDVFSTSSLIIPAVHSKCFYWRIVINGYMDSTLECTTTTEWKSGTYIQ